MAERLYRFDARVLVPTPAGTTVLAREIEVHAPERTTAWERLRDAVTALGALEVISARVVLEMPL